MPLRPASSRPGNLSYTDPLRRARQTWRRLPAHTANLNADILPYPPFGSAAGPTERGVEKQVSLEGVSSAEEVERKIASLL